jgi:AraC-like DNA-binding protein
MILREMPDLPPQPLTRSNADFRARFYARWGRENAIVCGRSRYAEYAPLTQTLSVKLAWGGVETYTVGKRRLSVDDDQYLILNEGQTYSSVLRGESEVASFCVFFRPKMAGEVMGAMQTSLAQAADDGTQTTPRVVQFAEHLRPHDDTVSPALQQLMRDVDAGTTDANSLEEALQDLLRRMLRAEHRLRDIARSISATKASTRGELLKRINIAADFICSHYAAPITLDDIAAAAALSKFHLVRLFRQIHGTSPHQFLTRKRLSVAGRLLDRPELGLDDVALLSGFGTRWSLFRQLRRTTGEGGAALRKLKRRVNDRNEQSRTAAEKGPV